MPYNMTWQENPHDENLPVLQELPDGVHEQPTSWLRPKLREAWGRVGDQILTFHYCDLCGGWIEGGCYEYQVSTMNSRRLSGRMGTSYNCRRCGEEIQFSGAVS